MFVSKVLSILPINLTIFLDVSFRGFRRRHSSDSVGVDSLSSLLSVGCRVRLGCRCARLTLYSFGQEFLTDSLLSPLGSGPRGRRNGV